MNVAGMLKQLNQKRNRVIYWTARAYSKWMLRGKILGIRCLARVCSSMPGKGAPAVREMVLPAMDLDAYLTVNCLGSVDVTAGDMSRELAALGDYVNKGVTFAVVKNPDASCIDQLEKQGITLLRAEKPITSRMYRTPQGNLAVILYDRTCQPGSDYADLLQIMCHILELERSGADYILAYIRNRPGDYEEKNSSRLCKTLTQMGVDYVIGVTPDRRDGGSTYVKPGGGVARSIYSIGAFLSENPEVSPKRVMLRLKLGAVQGKPRLVEETYIPWYQTEDFGLVSLLDENAPGLTPAEVRKYRAEICDEIQRIRPADRVLTVGMVMDIIGQPLPEKYHYLQDFSVGKICTRYFEVMPGDLFFFRDPYAAPNDPKPANPRRRLRIAGKVVKKGAMFLISYRELPFACPWVQVDQVWEAHIKVCAHIRRQNPARCIAITGSVGKTSTKDMLAEVMRMRFRTVKSERNANLQVAIGLNLQKLNEDCQVFIQEVGGGRPGGASRHSRMVLPEVAVVTNIGDAHIGNFGSREKLMANKLEIVDGLEEGGTLYLNGDDPLLAQAMTSRKTVFYAMNNKNADYYVEDLVTHAGYCTFWIVHHGTRTFVTLHVLGDYNVRHAVCCFAIGKQFGIPEADIVEGLGRFRTAGIRQNLMEVCGRKLFMDCYNASTESVQSAMDNLIQIPVEPGKKRIAVVGDITGLGALDEEVHRDIGDVIRQYPVDHVILFGQNVRFTYMVLREAGMNVRHCEKRDELNALLRTLVDVGDVVLFKGSSKMLLEYSVDQVFGTRLTDQRLRDEQEYKYVRRGSLVYDLFDNHATAEVYDPLRLDESRIQIAGKVGGIEVVNMGRALRGRNVAQVILPDSVRHISAEAFLDCTQLTEVRMSKKLKYIGNGAFKNCRNLREVKLPDQVLHIGARTFYGCSDLRKITIPASVVQIGEDAFAGCDHCEFICPKGSYAEQYLQKAGLLPGPQQ